MELKELVSLFSPVRDELYGLLGYSLGRLKIFDRDTWETVVEHLKEKGVTARKSVAEGTSRGNSSGSDSATKQGLVDDGCVQNGMWGVRSEEIVP